VQTILNSFNNVNGALGTTTKVVTVTDERTASGAIANSVSLLYHC